VVVVEQEVITQRLLFSLVCLAVQAEVVERIVVGEVLVIPHHKAHRKETMVVPQVMALVALVVAQALLEVALLLYITAVLAEQAHFSH